MLVAAMSLVAFGVLGWLGPFWALPTAFLREQAAAGGIALINSMGAVGGFVGPYPDRRDQAAHGGVRAGIDVPGGVYGRGGGDRAGIATARNAVTRRGRPEDGGVTRVG